MDIAVLHAEFHISLTFAKYWLCAWNYKSTLKQSVVHSSNQVTQSSTWLPFDIYYSLLRGSKSKWNLNVNAGLVLFCIWINAAIVSQIGCSEAMEGFDGHQNG